MTKKCFKRVVSMLLAAVMLMSTTRMAFATESNDQWQEEKIQEIMDTIKAEGGEVLTAGSIAAQDNTPAWYLLNPGTVDLNSATGMTFWFNVPSEAKGKTIKLLWAAGGDNWQETISTFNGKIGGVSRTLSATGPNVRVSTEFGAANMDSGTFVVTAKANCSGMYKVLFVLYVA